MEELSKEVRKKMINDRLERYKQQYFELKMQLVSFEACNDEKNASEIKKAMENIEKSYNAVEKLKAVK